MQRARLDQHLGESNASTQPAHLTRSRDRHRGSHRTRAHRCCDLFIENVISFIFTTHLYNLYHHAFVKQKFFGTGVDFGDRRSTYCWNSEFC